MSDPVTATANANAPVSTADTPLNDIVDSVATEAAPQKDVADQGPPFDVKALTDRALQFLATASNETLGACLVGLGAGTYLILGRVGLVLIGVVGGVVLHATWEGQVHGGEHAEKGKSSEARKRELGADVARRVLDWRGNKDKQDGDADDSDLSLKLYSGKALDFSEFKPETAAALTELTDAVIRDYVKWWYSPILPAEEAFPNSCRQTLTAFMISVSAHLSRKRPADNFVDFVTRSSSFMIILLQELSTAIMASPGDAPSEAIDLYLKMKRDSTLANILDPEYQAQQFSVAAEDILQNYLEHKTYNCMPARAFLHQILAKVVLEMIVVSCSKPDFINGWIVYLLEDGEPDILNAIDAGVEESSGQLQNVRDNIEKTTGESMSPEHKEHRRRVSKAQEAMDEAMQEAQRLSRLIAEEDAKRLKSLDESTSSLTDDQSASTTQGMITPTSSQSESTAEGDTLGLGISAHSAPSHSHVAPAAPASPPKAAEESKKAFTSFDQLLGNNPPTALLDDDERPVQTRPPPLTLYNSTMSIFDDSMPGEKGIIRNKPNVEYLIQIEPSSHHHSGWMTARKYTEFETLHEVIRRIAAITGTTGFTEAHPDLPAWKGHTKLSLRGELERYLNDAVKFKPLAESEGMKRFLEKELGTGKTAGGGFPGIGWAGQTFDTMGKGIGSTFDVLSKAPKEVAGGGKALFGGVTGVLGSVAPFGAKKNRDSVTSMTTSSATNASNSMAPLSRTSTNTSDAPKTRHSRAESIVPELPSHIRSESTLSLATKRTSIESIRNPNSPIIDQQPQREAQMERRPSYNPDGDGKRSGRSSRYGSRANSRAPSPKRSMDLSPALGGDQIMNLPPMPSEIEDDYNIAPSRTSLDPFHARNSSRASLSSLAPSNNDSVPPVPPLPRRTSATSLAPSTTTSPSKPMKQVKTHTPLSEHETTVLIELFFAVINELYTLSSAWTLRRTLLNAAKTFLLRPGNPQLASITTLFQTTLDSSTSDEGIAQQLRKMRENALPTEDELKKWPKESSDDEKERLRVKARRLLIERGMPNALTSVMGQAASGEALGKVFDCLQEPRVARGVMFGLTLQAIRAITQ